MKALGWLGLLAGLAGCTPAVPPALPTAVPPAWSAAARALDSAVASGAAPGAILAISLKGRHFSHGTGRLGLADSARPDSTTLYDLASLTKVLALTTVVQLLVEEGRLDLDMPTSRYVPAFTGGERDSVTLRQLLTHSSGLPPWRPLHLQSATREEALALVDTTALEAGPGSRYAYSDLGAIVLTQVVERVAGHRLDTLVQQRLIEPLALHETRFLPDTSGRFRIAPTEDDPWRGRILHGEVHDENASRLDGVSGHAGLFASARDLLVIGDWLVARWRGEQGTEAQQWSREFTRRQELPPGSSRALGWDTPSDRSSAGTRLGPASFGHTGFTGTSIWIDPERQLVIVLLSNRVHPTRQNPRWGPLRAVVADLVVEGNEASPHRTGDDEPTQPAN
jgi:CubicO group peptidase (beta-lactamase class C family)